MNYFTTAPEKMTLEQAKAGIIPGISGGVPPPLVEANMIQEFNRLIRGELSGDFVIEQPVQEAPLFTANPNA